jgi:hypothetical protein
MVRDCGSSTVLPPHPRHHHHHHHFDPLQQVRHWTEQLPCHRMLSWARIVVVRNSLAVSNFSTGPQVS